MKEQNDFYKLSDIKDENLKKMYVDKLSQMYKKDMSLPENYEQIKNFDIVVPKEDSQLHSQIKNSETTQKWVAENYDNIKNQTNKKTSLTFPITWKNDNAQKSLGLTFHKVDMSNAKVNEDGSFSVSPTDIPDYEYLKSKEYKAPDVNNKGEKLKPKEKIDALIDIFGSNAVTKINNYAFQQQEKEQYLKYLLSTDITYSKEELEEILKRFKSLR